MKTAIYIEDGVTQLVITPETEWEKSALKTMGKDGVKAEIFRGTFYDCRGGWVRQTALKSRSFEHGTQDDEDDSLIIKAMRGVVDE